ncbi:hypothetical protein bpr_II034 (plasmid) [Butyrivibrio proteoclasticus B316]|uniref:DUF5983 domain-containing protein n=1 Tax=Butyrivibrio proteoclasticus (strain ATCC 51982 / DSM 14932 / B316) TaxID=515622 RepID=E0S3J2_BUTPB|nr:hypothetical protein [Butyrivibrio proteoclasticus]ADL35974.1 hypothetical protein bpr_II034 [Butyrivibrio proteoclasticus B316]
MAKELELYKMMGMNTCHLSLDTKAVIPRMAAHTSSSVILHLKDNDFGCFIHIPNNIGECTDIPKDLKNCMIFAQNAGCEWLMFDQDAEIYDELKSYTWDGKEIQKAPSITADEVRTLAKERGSKQAYNILLLYGPDAFVGDYDEYNSLLDKLSKEQA